MQANAIYKALCRATKAYQLACWNAGQNGPWTYIGDLPLHKFESQLALLNLPIADTQDAMDKFNEYAKLRATIPF